MQVFDSARIWLQQQRTQICWPQSSEARCSLRKHASESNSLPFNLALVVFQLLIHSFFGFGCWKRRRLVCNSLGENGLSLRIAPL